MPNQYTRRPRPVADRFWSKVNKTDDCWEWTGGLVSGYGTINIDKRTYKAHRLSWIIHNGPIPDGMFICHHCDNRRCVRPDHLFVGTASDNMRDMVSKGRHPYPTGDDHPARKDGSFILRGEQNPIAKLTEDDVRAIRSEYARGGISQQAIADRYGVSQPVISSIIRREWWRHVQ